MRVALVVDDFALNFGHGRYTVELARRLVPRHEVHVFSNTFRVPALPGMHFHRVPCWRVSAISTVLTFPAWAEWRLRRTPVDLVHAQGMSCWTADVITGHMCNAAKYECLPAQGLRQRWFPWVVIPLERRFFRQRRARHFIGISRRFTEEIVRHYHWRKPITIIYHGTDTDAFRPPASEADRLERRAEYGIGPGQWCWLFMGEAVKGLRDTLARLPDFPAAVLLVISRSDLRPYRAEAMRLGVAHRVLFRGVESAPVRAFQAADVFVYPSRYDPFGLVVSEAMACGLPVVVSRTIGVAEWVEHGRNGLLCDPADPGSLGRSLASLAADPGLARALGQAARQAVLQYSWDRCAARTLEVYEETILAGPDEPGRGTGQPPSQTMSRT